MKLTKKTVYIGLFVILYLIVAFSSFFHACAFFGLANNSWMSIILAFAFEVGQAAVLFSLLTSSKDRGRIMPWVLMTMFTLVQVIGNVYSSYKYIIINSVENLRYFKEPIFIWTDLPDAQANVIIVYLVGAILPIAALLLTSMITNYLTDQSEENNSPILIPETIEKGPENPPIEIKNKEEFHKVYGDDNEVDGPPEGEEVGEELDDEQEIDNLNATINKKDEEIDNLKKELEKLKNDKPQFDEEKDKSDNDDGKRDVETIGGETTTESGTPEDITPTNVESNEEINSGNDKQEDKLEDKLEDNLEDKQEDKSEDKLEDKSEDNIKKKSHFINL